MDVIHIFFGGFCFFLEDGGLGGRGKWGLSVGGSVDRGFCRKKGEKEGKGEVWIL